jgi:hypothetical protein
MNNDTSCQQFPSEDLPREELDKLLLRVKHHVLDVMRKDSRLCCGIPGRGVPTP